MPTTLTKSVKLKDQSTHAGIRAVGIGVWDSVNRIVKTPTGVTALAPAFGAASIARLEVKNTTTRYVETGISGADNRNVGYNGSVTLSFSTPLGTEIERANLVTELCKSEIVAFLEYYDGSVRPIGSQNGAMCTAPILDSGGTIGDAKGFTVTITTMEAEPADLYLLTGTGLTDYATALKTYV